MDISRTPPETRYAKSGDIHIAYQTVGNGLLDLETHLIIRWMQWIQQESSLHESAGLVRSAHDGQDVRELGILLSPAGVQVDSLIGGQPLGLALPT
jgi:hypothetical protein